MDHVRCKVFKALVIRSNSIQYPSTLPPRRFFSSLATLTHRFARLEKTKGTWLGADSRSESKHAPSATHPRPDWSASDFGTAVGIPVEYEFQCIRTIGRRTVGFARTRRTLGAEMARPCSLRGLSRLCRRSAQNDLGLSRLGHQSHQRRYVLRSVYHRTTGWRFAPQPNGRATGGHRLSSQHIDQQ